MLDKDTNNPGKKQGKGKPYVSVNMKPDTRDRFNKLSKKHKISLLDLFEYSAIFFEKTGYDPKETGIDAPAEELKKLRNTIVSFIRKQESDVLIPMVNRMDNAVNLLVDLIKQNKGFEGNKNENIPEVIKPSLALKGGLKVPSANLAKSNNSETINEVIETPVNSDNTQLIIKAEKLEKERDILKETLNDLLNKVTSKSFGRGFEINLSNQEVEDLKQLL